MEIKEFGNGKYWPVRRHVNPCVVGLSWYRRSRSGKSARLQHPYWVLDYSPDASARIRVGSDRAPWRLRGAQVAHLYPPRTPYWEWELNPGAIQGGYVIFTAGQDIFLRQLINPGEGHVQIADPEGLIGLRLKEGAQAVARMPVGEISFWRAQETLCVLLSILSGARQETDGRWTVREMAGEVPKGLVAEVEAFLKPRVAESVILDDIARALHLSRSSLSHRYKALTGMSPMQTLVQLRIEQSQSLLMRGYKLDDIAEQCGFYDSAHFSRAFQAKTGQTPRRFARTLGG